MYGFDTTKWITDCCWWSQILEDVVESQWHLWSAQLITGSQLLQAMQEQAPSKADEAAPSPTAPEHNLEARALQCCRQGLAPPPEIYQAQYRRQLCWSALPNWAQPSDPDLFEGHEG